jgi:hypothetical protein
MSLKVPVVLDVQTLLSKFQQNQGVLIFIHVPGVIGIKFAVLLINFSRNNFKNSVTSKTFLGILRADSKVLFAAVHSLLKGGGSLFFC